MPAYPFRDRPPNDVEFERLRLALSSYRDGSGQVVLRKTGETMPGFRDFERMLAAVIGGKTTENKFIFDVEVQTDSDPYGLSCKMSSEQPAKTCCGFMELTNAGAAFRAHLLSKQINWVTEPMLAGPEIVELVTSWHYAAAGEIDVAASSYIVLSHNRPWTQFYLTSFPLDLKIAKPIGEIEWKIEGKSLNGYISDAGRTHRLWQCFLNSGGQLKYYPLLEWATWRLGPFPLEQPPFVVPPLEKAERYFPGDIWKP